MTVMLSMQPVQCTLRNGSLQDQREQGVPGCLQD